MLPVPVGAGAAGGAHIAGRPSKKPVFSTTQSIITVVIKTCENKNTTRLYGARAGGAERSAAKINTWRDKRTDFKGRRRRRGLAGRDRYLLRCGGDFRDVALAPLKLLLGRLHALVRVLHGEIFVAIKAINFAFMNN